MESNRPETEPQDGEDSVTFEFGGTVQSEAFFDRNPDFMPAFERLMTVANKCFGRRMKPRNRAEDICFGLGHTCRQDFLEVVFLTVNGYADAASKIIRGLYERAVAIAYIVEHPDKAERFVRFAAIQEHRLLESALRFVVTEKQWDAAIGPPNTAAQVRERYSQIKSDFKTTACKECGATRIQASWDLDPAAMVQKLGHPYDAFYLPAYSLPNLAIHATLTSAESSFRELGTGHVQRDADFYQLCATHLLILVIKLQNRLFSLNLDADIEASEQDVETTIEMRKQKLNADQP